MNQTIVYKNASLYCSFPSVGKMRSGKLIVVFRAAGVFSVKAALAGSVTHHDADSAIFMSVSEDEGETWSDPIEIFRGVGTNGVNDPAITVLSDDSLLLRFVSLDVFDSKTFNRGADQNIFAHRVEHGTVCCIRGNQILRSFDEGRTWVDLGISNSEFLRDGCSRDPILELSDGSLLMSYYRGQPVRTEESWLVRSFDGGHSWVQPTLIASAGEDGSKSQQHGINYSETSIVILENNRLLALCRADESFCTVSGDFVPVGGLGYLRTSVSQDAGLSWSPLLNTGIYGTPGSLCVLSTENIVATYGYRSFPYGVRAVLSNDGGLSWNLDREIILDQGSCSWDCGYPSTIALSSGKLLTVYYANDSEGVRFIASVKWRCH